MNEIEILINSSPGISEEIMFQKISGESKHHFHTIYNNRVILDKVTAFLLEEKGLFSKQDMEFTANSSYFMIIRWYPKSM